MFSPVIADDKERVPAATKKKPAQERLPLIEVVELSQLKSAVVFVAFFWGLSLRAVRP